MKTSFRYWAVVAVGLAALLSANYYLRSELETAGQYMFNFYNYFYPAAAARIFAPDFPKWRLLLPLADVTGSWSPTILVLTHYLSVWLGPAQTWLLTNAVLMIVSFAASWTVFRSRIFSFTLAICMGFGTQLFYAYPNSGLIGFPLYFCYLQILLLCIYRVTTAERHRLAWKAAFCAALVVTALAYETWLDFVVFVWLASTVLGFMLWRRSERVWLRRLAGVVAVMTVVGCVHLYIKVTLGYGQARGMETDLVFNYPFLAPAVEDVVSNLFLNLYMALTNFLPPMFVSSTAFYQLGGDRLVELQHGYHAPFTYLVPMQSLFMWRYFAGVIMVLFVYAAIRTLKAASTSPSFHRVAALVFTIMIATGGPTHTFVKARPFNSMAVQSYHVWVPVLGVSLLISLLLMLAWRRWPRLLTGGVVVAGVWAIIFYSALARPGMIAHQAAQSGLGVRVYPDPMANLKARLGWTFVPGGGLDLYQLERHDPVRAAAEPALRVAGTFGANLSPLPSQSPPLAAWSPQEGVRVESSASGWLVHGNDTATGYQLVSPAIQVPRQQQLLVRVAGTSERGLTCFGILNGDQSGWLLAPEPGRSEHGVNTGLNAQVWLVFANCMADSPKRESVRFRVDHVTYGVVRGVGSAKP